MTPQDIYRFKRVLEQEKKRLEDELAEVPEVSEMGTDVDSYDSTEADEAEELVNNASVRGPLRERLEAVNNAIDKIKRGAYGVCEKCFKDIEVEVLEASPESRHCKSCKATEQ